MIFAHLLADSMAVSAPHARAVVRAIGTGYGLGLVLAGVLFTAVPMGAAVGELPGAVPVETFRVLTQAGFYALLVPGLLCAGVLMVATWAGLRESTTATDMGRHRRPGLRAAHPARFRLGAAVPGADLGSGRRVRPPLGAAGTVTAI